MTGYCVAIAIIMTSIPNIAYLSCGNLSFLHIAAGQAEETFGQNTTFLEEVEEMQSQTQAATPASQNQTSANSTQILETLLQQELKGPHALMTSSNVEREPKARIVVSGVNAYIVWETNMTGDWEVMLRASNDNGKLFREKINLSNSTGIDSANVEIAASGSNVFVIWRESGPINGTSDPMLRISNDNGQTFGPILELSSNGTIEERQTILTYDNSSYGIQMQYPSDWQVTVGEEDNDGVIDIAGFHSPLEYRLDKYVEKLWISLDQLRSENITLEEYFIEVVNYKNGTLEDFQLIDHDTDSAILAGYPAYRLVYTSTLEDGTSIKQMEIGTKIGNNVYYLDYYAEKEKYNAFLPVIQEMINSIEIADK